LSDFPLHVNTLNISSNGRIFIVTQRLSSGTLFHSGQLTPEAVTGSDWHGAVHRLPPLGGASFSTFNNSVLATNTRHTMRQVNGTLADSAFEQPPPHGMVAKTELLNVEKLAAPGN